MEGGFPFGFGDDDADEIRRQFADFVDRLQADAQSARADTALELALEMTLAGVKRISAQGTPDGQTQQVRAVVETVFPEALALVREALESHS